MNTYYTTRTSSHRSTTGKLVSDPPRLSAVVPGGSRTGAVGVFPFRLGGQPEFTIGEHVSLFTKGDSLTMAHRVHRVGGSVLLVEVTRIAAGHRCVLLLSYLVFTDPEWSGQGYDDRIL
ncbi:MAG: hypothetical protein MKZ70_07480, partial [Opitutales bacterium]|nr:hypothetical protein [Opitutales bacterium]